MITSICATKLSSSCVSPQTVDGIGSRLWLSSVAPVVVSSTNESPGRVSVVLSSTETSDLQSNSSPRAVKRSWLSRAHTVEDDQLPWPMPYNSLSVKFFMRHLIPQTRLPHGVLIGPRVGLRFAPSSWNIRFVVTRLRQCH
jgi:hypothetical protein